MKLSRHLLWAKTVGNLACIAAAVLLPQVTDRKPCQTTCPAGIRGQRTSVFQPAHSGTGVTSCYAGEFNILACVHLPCLETVQDGGWGLVGVWWIELRLFYLLNIRLRLENWKKNNWAAHPLQRAWLRCFGASRHCTYVWWCTGMWRGHPPSEHQRCKEPQRRSARTCYLRRTHSRLALISPDRNIQEGKTCTEMIIMFWIHWLPDLALFQDLKDTKRSLTHRRSRDRSTVPLLTKMHHTFIQKLSVVTFKNEWPQISMSYVLHSPEKCYYLTNFILQSCLFFGTYFSKILFAPTNVTSICQLKIKLIAPCWLSRPNVMFQSIM